MTHDDVFLTFNGEPIAGRVPAGVQVHGGKSLTPAQEAGVSFAYKRFKDALRVSILQFAVDDRTLEDGTRVRIVSNSGLDQVQVWPPDTRVEQRGLRGFVLRPFWEDPADVEAALDRTILLEHKGATWKAWVKNYRPGKDDAIGYIVLESNTKRIKGMQIDSDQAYFDVLSLWNDRLHHNGVAVMSATGASDQAMPALMESGGTKALLVIESGVVRGWVVGTLTALYNFASYFAPVATGFSFQAGPRYDPAGPRVQFLGLNKTSAGALQKWRADIALSTSGTAITTQEFDQIGAETAMLTSGGWNATSQTITVGDEPIFGGVTDPNNMSIYAHYVGAPASKLFTDMLLASDYSAIAHAGDTRPTYSNFHQLYTSDGARIAAEGGSPPLSTSETLTLYDGVTATVERVIEMETIYADTPNQLYYGKLPIPQLYWDGTYTAGAKSVIIPTANPLHGLQWFSQNDPVPVIVYREHGEIRTHLETATSTITVTDMPHPLHEATVDRTDTGKDGFKADEVASTPAAGPLNLGGDAAWDTYRDLTKGTTTVLDWRTDEREFTADLVSRDYLFTDVANDVYVWVQCSITSEETQERLNGGSLTTDGTTTITITLEIESPHLNTSVTLATYDQATAINLTLIDPSDINMGSSDLTWKYHRPPRLEPVFAPPWQEQGLCPHIAYTTALEHDADIAKRFLFSIRLQMVKTEREITDTDPPVLDGAFVFAPYMMEQLLRAYGKLGTIFDDLEAASLPVHRQYPTDSALDGAGLAVVASRHGHYYRT